MTARETILARVREALSLSAHQHGERTAHAVGAPRDFLPESGDSFEDRVRLFAVNASDLKTDFRRVPDVTAATAALRDIAASEGWNRIATHGDPMCDSITPALGLPVLNTGGGYATADLEACAAGITGCDALVAQTGSVLLTAKSGGGRALSVLPPHHVVLASAGQLLADLPDAFGFLAERYGEAYPSFMTLITGPSRTGDIERTLVLGAHGPKALTVILVG